LLWLVAEVVQATGDNGIQYDLCRGSKLLEHSMKMMEMVFVHMNGQQT